MMCFHRISPCPKCGGKVKAKWESLGHGIAELHCDCHRCGMRFPFVPVARLHRDRVLCAFIRRWNAMCNGDKQFKRSWVLATHDGDSIRRIRLSWNELGDLEDILQSIANERRN